MKDIVKRKSAKNKEKESKKKDKKLKEDELNIFEDIDIRELKGEKEREEMYEKKLELIKNLYINTR